MSKINILLWRKKSGGLQKPGGAARAMFEYANNLSKRGHEVTILISAGNFHPHQHRYYDDYGSVGWSRTKYWEKKLAIAKRIRRIFTSIFGRKEIKSVWFDLLVKTYLVPSFSKKHIPDADVTIFLDWWALLWVAKYPRSKGKKVWFIRTIYFLPPTKKVKEIFSFPVLKITNSNFMKKKIEKLGGKNVSVILNGVNLKQFHNSKKTLNREKRICMVSFDSAPYKGIEDGIKAFEIARAEHPEIKLVMFGVDRGLSVPEYCEFHRNPPQRQLQSIYSSCDIFLYPARTEASANPPREAMACKCAVVGTTAGGITDYAVSGKTALLSEPEDFRAMSKNLIRLIENQALLKKISLAGYEKIQEFSWHEQTKKLEDIIAKG